MLTWLKHRRLSSSLPGSAVSPKVKPVRNEIVTKSGLEILPVLPAEKLLSEGDRPQRCREIAERVGVPDDYFAVLYLPALQSFARFVQRILLNAATREAHHPLLLDHTLSIVVAALTLRRGYLLPAGAEPEVIDQQHDIWTYAVFTAALLRDIGRIATEPQVTIYPDRTHPAGRWDPWQGPLPIGVYYHVEQVASAVVDVSRQITPLFAPWVLPAQGLHWLVSYPAVYTAWLTMLMGNTAETGRLAEILRLAEAAVSADTTPGQEPATSVETLPRVDQTIVSLPRSESKPKNGGSDTSATASQAPLLPAEPHLGQRFLTWLQTELAGNRLPINTANANVHRVPEGIFLISPAIFKDFAIALGKPPLWKDVQKHFQKMKLHQKNARGENIHGYSIQGGKPGNRINGLLLLDMAILFSEGRLPELSSTLVKYA